MTGSLHNQPRSQVRASLPPADEQAAETVIGEKTDGRIARSLARMEQLRVVIDMLRAGPVTKDDVCVMLRCSESAARLYLNSILDAGVVSVTRVNSYTCRIYALIDDPERINAFINKRVAPPRHGGDRRSAALTKAMADGSRRFHWLKDDTYIAVRIHQAPASPDPLALPPGFFRAKAAQGEPLPRPAPAPRVPAAYFPTPAEHPFSLEVTA